MNQGLIKALSVALLFGTQASARTWTLQECIDYALENNISLRQSKIKTQQSHEDMLQSRSALFPSVSFSTNQNMSYRPFSESTINLTNGSMTSSSNKVSYNGSYGINANWTVWNGNKNRMNIQQNKLTEQMNELMPVAVQALLALGMPLLASPVILI